MFDICVIFAFPFGCSTIPLMAFDPTNPPIWLRKLHVSAAQMSPDDYPLTPEEGILQCCQLSDELGYWSRACADALGIPPLPPLPPFHNPFRLTSASDLLDSEPHDIHAPR
jgi:hypothetical protein